MYVLLLVNLVVVNLEMSQFDCSIGWLFSKLLIRLDYWALYMDTYIDGMVQQQSQLGKTRTGCVLH